MSEENKIVSLDEQLAISAEDAKNVFDYFNHFKIEKTEELVAAIKLFEKEQTVANQKALKLALCRAMRTSKHESFVDKMFNEVKKTASKAEYDLQFDQDLRNEIGRKKD